MNGSGDDISDRDRLAGLPDLASLPLEDRTLLVVDDDAPLCHRLARAMEQRGFVPSVAMSVAEGSGLAAHLRPAFAVVDLRLGDGSGIDVVGAIRTARPSAAIVMLTGYGNIATAVAAVKAGAIDYLPKPVDADTIELALRLSGASPAAPPEPMSADQVRWEHIQRVYESSHRNVSETARRLKMHRRTLQRILSKSGPQDPEA
jgi:two-component system response regulator RegA